MAYCPEDGVEMKQVHEDTNTVCYDCPHCDSHWTYDGEGGPGYFLSTKEECPWCVVAVKIQAERRNPA